MNRNKETRLFGTPASIGGGNRERDNGFVIKIKGNWKDEFDGCNMENHEIHLVNFAKSEYAKQLATDKNADKFLFYCLNNIYHTSINDIINKNKTIVNGAWDTEWYVLVAGVAILGAVLAVEMVFYFTPEELSTMNIRRAAILCGGQEFGDSVTNRFIELIQKGSGQEVIVDECAV